MPPRLLSWTDHSARFLPFYQSLRSKDTVAKGRQIRREIRASMRRFWAPDDAQAPPGENLVAATIQKNMNHRTGLSPVEAPDFDYSLAFSRNLGWVTSAEQASLRKKRVAIAGLGGVGGFHLLTLARLGIGAFNLAEFDHFELANFNRQAGARMSNIRRPKLEVLIDLARDINPELDIRPFPDGIGTNNVESFLSDADAYVDGLDFFAYEARSATFGACARLGVPATTAAPLGMGVAVLNFLPGKMTFEEYFGFEGQPEAEKALRFLLGLSPSMLQRNYLADRSRVDFAARTGPSTPMACQLCAGVAATEILKILLKRGPIWAAPFGIHFDAYRCRMKRTWRPGGYRNPLQRLSIVLARRYLAAKGRS